MDAFGHATIESRGTSGTMKLTRTYDATTGRLSRLCAGLSGACGLMDEQYGWDANGNLHSHLKDSRYSEEFTYDTLDRLVEAKYPNGTVTQAYVYDALGNICRKQEWGQTYDYVYTGRAGCGVGGLPGGGSESPIGPHQLAQVGVTYMTYDDHGNQITKSRSDTPGTWKDRGVAYSLDDHPYEIALGAIGSALPIQRTRFWYGSDGQRYKREDGGTRTLYLGNVEVITTGGSTTYRRYIGDAAIQDVTGATAVDRYIFKDQLGSVVKIADANGAALQTRDFDAFGEKRNPTNAQQQGTIQSPVYTTRGFTGHETIDGAYLTYAVHMGGRLYDSSPGASCSRIR
jgi:YD repeat-containing protein